jgi:RNA polymerase sigma-70 factor (ECF subfamily)
MMKKSTLTCNGACKPEQASGNTKAVTNFSGSDNKVLATRYHKDQQRPLPIGARTRTSPEHNLSINVEKQKIKIDEEAPLLLSYLAQGDADAFWKLWEGYQDYLYRLCLRQMEGSREDAEDALSKAMIRARQCLPVYAGEIIDLKAWLTRLILNLCVDIHRHRNRLTRGVVSLDDIGLADEWNVAQVFESPEQAYLYKEMHLYLLQAIDDLPQLLRKTSILYFIQERSYKDIADDLTLSIENTRKRIQQARAILREKFTMYKSGLDSQAKNRCHAGTREGSNLQDYAVFMSRDRE